MFRVAFKDLMAHKRRIVTTGLAVILGITFLSGTQILGGVLDQSIRGLVSEIYDDYDAVVRSPSVQETAFGEFRAPVDAAVVDQVGAVDGVAVANGVVETPGVQLIGEDGKVVGGGFGPPTIVLNWFDDALRPATLREGAPPVADDEIVLDTGSADEQGWGVGDRVALATQDGTSEFTVVGVAGLGDDAELSTGARPLYFTTATAQALAKLPGQFTYVAVGAEEGVEESDLVAAIAAAVPDQQVITGEAFTEQSQDQIAGFVSILTTFVTVFGVVSLVVATFIIYNTFSIIVAQRTRQTALLRAIGARRRQVLTATVVEALIIGVVASVVGLVLGTLLATGLKWALGQLFTTDAGIPRLTVGTVVMAFAVGIGVTVLSAFIPALRSSRIPPIAALSEVSLDRSGVSTARKVWGVLFVVGGVVLVAVGLQGGSNSLQLTGAGLLCILVSVAVIIGPVLASPASHALAWPLTRGNNPTARLAAENAARNPKRTAATAAALTVGVTLVVVIAVLAASVKSSVDSEITGSIAEVDLIVTAGNFSFLGIPPAVAEEAGSIDGVEVVSPVGFTFLRLLDDEARRKAEESPPADDAEGPAAGLAGAANDAPPGEDVVANGIDPPTYTALVDMGEIKGDISRLGDSSMLALERTAEDRGWEIGDRIPVYFTATGLQELTLEATYSEPFGPGDNYLLPLETLRANALPGFDVDALVFIGLEDGADTAAVTQALEALVADRPDVVVQDRAEYIADQTAIIDVFVLVVYALLALAVLIALVGIANTLSLSVLERTREFGLLRAVGMSRTQLRWVVRFEAAIVAVFGTLLGMVIGIAFAAALTVALGATEPGLLTLQLPVVQLVAITVFAALAGILAAIIPARRAAKLDVLAAIASE